MMQVKLRHLVALVRLNELRNMRRAAEAMGISQPSMSQLIADLEALLETRLYLRHARGMEPTPIARELTAIAQRVINAVEDGAELLATQLHHSHEALRIAATSSVLETVLAPRIPSFAARHPAIRVSLDEVNAGELDRLFANGEFDVIGCRQREVLPEGWSFTPLVQDHFVVICAADHPQARATGPALAALRQATWVANHVRTASRRGFEALKAYHGWQNLKTANLTTRSLPMVLELLQHQQMVTVLPATLAQPWLRQGIVAEVALETGVPPWQLGLHFRPAEVGRATRLLLQALQPDQKPRG